jgi:hypothetical protein
LTNGWFYFVLAGNSGASASGQNRLYHDASETHAQPKPLRWKMIRSTEAAPAQWQASSR